MPKAYLSIDDSPTEFTDDLTDWLVEQQIPAILFVRGERMENNSLPIINAIQKGLRIGNHLYSHRRSSELSYEEVIEEIEKTEALINEAFQQAGKERAEKYIRFPHMDRGTAGWIVDYDQIPERYKNDVESLFWDGLNVSKDKPSAELIEKKNRLEKWLKNNDFVTPYKDITFPWYANTEVGQAIDAMYTFSTSDWMLTKRHKDKHQYKTTQDLKRKIDTDPYLHSEDSPNIVLMHDDPENILDVTKDLVSYMKDIKNIKFI